MTASTSNRAPFVAALAAILLVLPSSVAHAQWAPFEALPGADRVRAAERPRGNSGRVSEVRWDADGSRAWFQYGGKWKSVAAKDGAVAEGEPPAAPEKPKEYKAPRGGRAQQATRVPSPDAKWTAVHADANVRLEPAGGGEPVAVTTEGEGKHWYGSADWVYGEELDQVTAMWWSPDSSMLAYYDFDESPVKDFVLLSGLATTRTKAVVSGYPKPGDRNPVARLEIYDVASRTRTKVDVGQDAEQYVYGVEWSPKGDALLWFRANRRQDRVELMATDPRTGASRVVLAETQATWQKNSPALRFLADGRRFLWESESNGFANWELHDLRDGRIARLTDDPWPAESIVAVDEPSGWLYYTARSGKVGICSQLHRARLDGSRRERLTKDELHHSGFSISPSGKHFVAVGEFVDVPPSASLCAMDGSVVTALTKPAPDPYGKDGIPAPEFLELTADDGVTVLYGLLYKPRGFDPSRAYPLVVETYGGPLFATVSPRFGSAEANADFGVLVAKLDNRGTPGRGKSFEGATYLKLGGPDVDDQATLVRELAKRPYVDGTRVAVTGHSYGGYMALMCVLRYPELFQVAVAGAPPTDWRQYDTIYTERVMRTPAENEAGYDAGSAVKLAGKLKGRVLLLHGMVDDNVHPNNTFAIAQAWQQSSTPFEMMLFPNSDHGIRSPAYEATKWSFILRNFGMWEPKALGAAPAAATGGEPMKAK
jgi:dipeptidyl-peptidase-4